MRTAATTVNTRQRPVYYPGDNYYRGGWGVENPYGHTVYFDSPDEAEGTLLLWADEQARGPA